jgi:hypothetical protein
MPVERFPPDDPREWLNRARSSLAKARGASETPEVYLEDLGSHITSEAMARYRWDDGGEQ